MDVAEVAFEVAELFADGGADFVGAGGFVEDDVEVGFAGFFAVGAWFFVFVWQGGVEYVDDALGFSEGFVEEFEVGGVGYVGGGAAGIDEELAVVGGGTLWGLWLDGGSC
jgi:hypothetical protein